MRYLLTISLFALNLLITPYIFAATAFHQIVFKAPHDMPWKLSKERHEKLGYIKMYIPKTAQNDKVQALTINYGRGIKTPLKNSMQEVLNVIAVSDCQHKDSKIIKKQHNMLIFSVSMDHCLNGKSLLQIFKVFNANDGQYSILYTADQNLVPPRTLRKMQAVIENAKLVSRN